MNLILFPLRASEKTLLVSHLASMVEDGGASDHLSRTGALAFASGTFRKHAEHIAESLRAGASLSEALSRLTRSFAAWETALVRAGEQAGALAPALRAWQVALRRTTDIRHALRASAGYAAIVLFFLLLTYATIAWQVMPTFRSIWMESGRGIPAAVTVLFGDWGSILLMVFFTVAAACIFAAGKALARRRHRALALDIVAALTSAGVAPAPALRMTAASLPSRAVRLEMEEHARSLEAGAPLIPRARGVLDAAHARLVAVALASRRPGEAVSRLASHAAEACERDSRRTKALAHDGVVLGLGLLVGIMLICAAPLALSPVVSVIQ